MKLETAPEKKTLTKQYNNNRFSAKIGLNGVQVKGILRYLHKKLC